ncbi:MAG: UDP-glucuronic acid decarboxylase family protein [Gemmatimonadota bacterium]
MKTILVTGAAGFLGSHLCDRLVEEGARVIGVDNLLTGRIENLAELPEGRFRLLQQDVSAPIRLDEPVDAILNFASPASPFDYLEFPIETLEVGSAGTRRILELAREHGARYLQASTSEVYGDPEVNPQPETYHGHVNPIGPRGVYDEAKRFGEALTMAYHRRHGVEVRIARIFNTYGPRMRPHDGRVVSTFICQALVDEPVTVFGDGSQTRSFCYVDDLIEGILRLLRSDYNGPVNLGNPVEIEVGDLAERIISMTDSGSRIVYRPLPEDDPRVRRPDIALARELLGWEPEVNLEKGLGRTIEYYRGLSETVLAGR